MKIEARLLLRRGLTLLGVGLTIALLLCSCANVPSPSPSPTCPPSPSATAPPVPTATPLPTPTHTPPPPATATPTLVPTVTPLPGPLHLVGSIAELLPGGSARLYGAPDGALWLATDQSVVRLVDGVWNTFLADYTGSLAGIDAAGRALVVSEDGSTISAWDGVSWTTWGAADGWSPLADGWHVGHGQSDGVGHFWLDTSQDVRLLADQHWTVFTAADMGMGEVGALDLTPVFTIMGRRDGAGVWVTECDWGGPGPFGGQGVRWYDGQTWHGADSVVASGCANAVASDDAGYIWLGVEADLWRYDPVSDEWARFPLPAEQRAGGTRPGVITSINPDPAGDLWVTFLLCGGASCSTYALYHWHGNAWTQEIAEGWVDADALFADAAGARWLVWDSVYRLGAGNLELTYPLLVRFATVDATGRLWLVASTAGQDTLWYIGDEMTNQ